MVLALLLIALPCRAREQHPADLDNAARHTTLNLKQKIHMEPAGQQSRGPAGNKKIQRLQEGIIEHKVKILHSQLKERSILTELEEIDLTLLANRKVLKELHQKSEAQEKLLGAKEDALAELTGEKEALKKHIKNRLAAYYRTGPVSLLNVIFSSATLPDLLTFQEYFSHLVQHDKEVITSYVHKILELRRTREELLVETNRLEQLAQKTEHGRQELAQTRTAKKKLLGRINTEKALYTQAADEIEKAALELAETLRRFETRAQPTGPEAIPEPPAKIPPVVGQPPAPTGFAGQQGRLPRPVKGPLTSSFGRSRPGEFGVKITSRGVDFKPQPDAEIRAVFPGRIITGGYMRGYGNMLIIDHGNQYYTVTSRAAEFFKAEGDQVATGEVLGVMGDDPDLVAQGLHFEIRHGAIPQDPLLWLNPTGLEVIKK